MTEYELVRMCFIFSSLALIGTGFHVARKLTNKVPEYIRIAVITPALAGISYLIGLFSFDYIPFWNDIIAVLSTLVIYMFVASLFTERPWIDFRK
jgi:hypothetical protein